MSERADFLTRMVDRVLERTPVVEPRVLSRFETRLPASMPIEPPASVAEETTGRGSAREGRVHEARDAGPRDMHRGLREARTLREAEPRLARAPVNDPQARADPGEESSEPVSPPAQTLVHRVIHEQRPALVPRMTIKLPPAEVARPAAEAPGDARVDDSRTPASRDAEAAPTAGPPDRVRDTASTPPRTERLLPKQPLVSEVVARATGSRSTSRDPSTTAPESVSDTVVQVTIGRVEVKAGKTPQNAAASARRPNAHQPMSLGEYLQKRGATR